MGGRGWQTPYLKVSKKDVDLEIGSNGTAMHTG
jgi:hypothetical protein